MQNSVRGLSLFAILLIFTGTVLAASQAKEVSAKTPEAKDVPAKAGDTKAGAKVEQKKETAKSEKEEEKNAELSLVHLLEKKMAELDAKEMELKEREARLNQLSQEIEAKIARYGKLRQEIEASYKKKDAAEEEKVSGLVKIYESMTPKDAAARLQELDEDIALIIFSKMKQKTAAKILALIEPARAAALSQGLVRNRKVSKLK